ncbi:MAG: phenylalanine--tRNA ligase subunit beta [Candidatus Micrarchaeota archaeon]|nr:phenylalanine--tRNA ligase subunit beta [Candidatus Micrarchaeota archaeon]
MAVVAVDPGVMEKKSGLSKDKIIDTLTRMGAPTEEKEERLAVEVTPNRPDLFSTEGILRALACYNGKKAPEYKVKKADYRMTVGKGVESIRPFVRCGVVKGVKIDDETIQNLMQMQEKLHDTAGRRRKKVAIGIHDLNGIVFPLEYAVGEDETFVPLDCDEEMSLDDVLDEHPKGVAYAALARHGKVLIKDKNGIVSFPPIINSERTRVTEKTKDVLLDVTGTSKEAVEGVLNIIAASFADAGGTLYSVDIDGKEYPDMEWKKIKYDEAETNRVLGLELGKKDVKIALEKMGYTFKDGYAFVPPYRMDIISFIDIIEDVAIGHGYEKFTPELPQLPTIGALADAGEGVHAAMCGMGFLEAKNYVLTNERMLEGTKDNGRARIVNSTSVEFGLVRTSLIPGLLFTCQTNKTKGLPQKFYELGGVWSGREVRRLGFVIIGNKVNFSVAQSVLQALAKELGMKTELKAIPDERFIPGRCYSVSAGGKELGLIGEIAPQVLEKHGLEYPLVACELEL